MSDPSPPLLRIRGARTHNLRGVDLDLPLRGLTVLVGRSGSGKTSLAIDTIHAASRARLRAALGSEPHADAQPVASLLSGLPVTLAVTDQAPLRHSTRLMDVADLALPLGTLGAGLGTVCCPVCDRPLPVRGLDAAAAELLGEPPGSRATLLAPVARGRTGSLAELVSEIARQGFSRVEVDGVAHRVEELPPVDARLPHDLDVVVDRLRLGPDRAERLEEALATALAAGQGRVLARVEGPGHQPMLRFWSERPWCPDHPADLEAPRANWLAGGGQGRCRSCQGNGRSQDISCLDCAGTGLRVEVRTLRLGSLADRWPALLARPLHELASALRTLAADGAMHQVRVDLLRRLDVLLELGLGSLPGTRTDGQLSSGELRLARLARALAVEVPGLMLILDEPTAGLDEDRAGRLLACLTRVAATGRPVLAVDHRRSLVDSADHVVAFGPEAGHRGGQVTWQGPGAQLPHALLPPPPTPPVRHRTEGPAIVLAGARGEGLGSLDARFPLGALTAVRGPTGSGKSALVTGTLVPVVQAALGLVGSPPLPYDAVYGLDQVTQLLTFDRSPLGRNSNAIVATTLSAWAPLRDLLSATRQARILGIDAARFRLDRPGGRCEACQGSGLEPAPQGLVFSANDDAEAEACTTCGGQRFQRDVLRVRLKGRSVAELLALDLDEAAALFAAHRRLGPPLLAARLVGLGYLPLGQSSCSLSAGEAQRLRLVRELARLGGFGPGGEPRRQTGRMVVLDGPTVGLHPQDIAGLLELLRRLAEGGATVVVAGEEPRLVEAADHVIEVG